MNIVYVALGCYSRTSEFTDPTDTDCSVNRTLKLNKDLVSIIKSAIKSAIKRVTGKQILLNITKL